MTPLEANYGEVLPRETTLTQEWKLKHLLRFMTNGSVRIGLRARSRLGHKEWSGMTPTALAFMVENPKNYLGTVPNDEHQNMRLLVEEAALIQPNRVPGRGFAAAFPFRQGPVHQKREPS